MPEREFGPLPPLAVVAFGVRDRARDLLKRSFPRRRGRLTLARTRANQKELQESFNHDIARFRELKGG